jgi:2-dehydro-3-deoxy-D-gluconate 5-dehydrogenase
MNRMNNFRLDGKTALVTGCNKGIGFAMAVGLAEAGAQIIGVSSGGDYKAIEDAIKATGQTFAYHQTDLGNREDLYRFLNNIQDIQIDILVNNAGIIKRQAAAEHSDEYWDSVLSVNLDAQFILARELGKKMIAYGAGKIIFTASLLSFQGGINVPSYAAAKSAISGLVKALANEWASKGVNVNAIAPGYIETDNTKALREDKLRNDAILSRIPANRWGNPDDFKGPAVFLASKASDYVHGTLLVVDGGWMGR